MLSDPFDVNQHICTASVFNMVANVITHEASKCLYAIIVIPPIELSILAGPIQILSHLG